MCPPGPLAIKHEGQGLAGQRVPGGLKVSQGQGTLKTAGLVSPPGNGRLSAADERPPGPGKAMQGFRPNPAEVGRPRGRVQKHFQDGVRGNAGVPPEGHATDLLGCGGVCVSAVDAPTVTPTARRGSGPQVRRQVPPPSQRQRGRGPRGEGVLVEVSHHQGGDLAQRGRGLQGDIDEGGAGMVRG